MVLGVPKGIFVTVDVVVCDVDCVLFYRTVDVSSVGGGTYTRSSVRDALNAVCGDEDAVQYDGNGVQHSVWDLQAIFSNIQLRGEVGGTGDAFGV